MNYAAFRSFYLRYREAPTILTDAWTVGFCGKIYPVVRVNLLGDPKDTAKFCYTIEEVDEWVEEHFSSKMLAHFREKQWNDRNRWCWSQRRNSFVGFLSKEKTAWSVQIEKQLAELFVEHRSPLFLAHNTYMTDGKSELTFNALLRQVEFFRIFDPYTAFQEISMFMSNLAVPMKPIPVPSDEIMLEVKGFDKFSFRKDKKGPQG